MKFKNESVVIPSDSDIELKIINNTAAYVFKVIQDFNIRYNEYNCVAFFESCGKIVEMIKPGDKLIISGYDKQNLVDGKKYYNYVVTCIKIGN